MFFLRLSFLALSFSLAAAHGQGHQRHARIANARSNSSQALSPRGEHELTKRVDNARLTFFQPGLGACGSTNGPGDFIVALNSPQYAGGQHCHEMITITFKGKSTQAQIMDECPGCPFGGLDLTPSLFEFFASKDDGVIEASWNFGGHEQPAKPPPPAAKPKPTPSSTSTPKPPPTTSTSSKAKSVSRSSSSSKSSSASSSSSVVSTSATKTNNAIATSGPVSGGGGSIDKMNQAVMGLAALVDAGRGA